jgi:hypothetical protein
LEEFIECTTKAENQTPLHLAAKEGSKAVVESFISEYNVNKEALDYKNRTALFIAAEFSKELE